ncbi:MAG: PilZ domain-containing protein, partial [Proteobacteria bacterium]|nr:PilZ domain-containing protein [Pseudomonadota bacterium]
MIFAGECKIAQIRNGVKTKKNFIFQPLNLQIKRFAPKNFRASRYQLVPSPYVIFTHPFSGKKKSLGILDISGSGFSVKEDSEAAMLMPGMILPEIEIHLANSFNVKCKTQVVHRAIQDQEDRGGAMKIGLAILDMDVESHGKILSLLHQAKNPNLYLDGQVNEDDLWRFFFETGFIYPGKYKFIRENKEDLKALYKTIYSDSSKIAKHFIYQDQGEILGHMAMIRFYRKTWMIQHHASDNRSSNIAGIDVLDQIGRFINESSNLVSMNMDFVFCYYRSDNKFPNQVFGGAARYIAEPKICSENSFSYFHYKKKDEKPSLELKEPWRLSSTEPQDLIELKIFYQELTSGIMIDALELVPESMDLGELKDEYSHLGLKRERHLFSLRRENQLKAVFSINSADIGLNFSDITNSIHVFIIDSEELEVEILEISLMKLSTFFSIKDIPILIYPETY